MPDWGLKAPVEQVIMKELKPPPNFGVHWTNFEQSVDSGKVPTLEQWSLLAETAATKMTNCMIINCLKAIFAALSDEI